MTSDHINDILYGKFTTKEVTNKSWDTKRNFSSSKYRWSYDDRDRYWKIFRWTKELGNKGKGKERKNGNKQTKY